MSARNKQLVADNMAIVTPLTIEHVLIGQLRPDAANPRRISDAELDALTRSIREFGFVDPIIARREDRVVIGGHQRLIAARRLGLKTVPAIYLDIKPDQAKVLGLALNRISGSWDNDLLAQLLSDLKVLPNVDLTLSGFGEDEIAGFLKSLEAKEKRQQLEDFNVVAAIEEANKAAPRTKPGDLWLLDGHKLLCGDATKSEDLDHLVAGTKAAMTFTDPPYNVDYGHHDNPRWGRNRPIANDALSPENWEEFCRAWVRSLLDSVNGALYICMSCKEWPVVSRILDESGAHWSTTIIWAKDRFTLGRADYQRGFEPIWYGWREGAKHFWCGDRDQGDVWTIDRPSANELHPIMKLIELVEKGVENSSRPGDTVLDLFLGSGSTLIAAERTGRVCWAMELDPRYCDVAVRRWEAFTGRKAQKSAE